MARVLLLCEYATLLGGERSILATLPDLQRAEFQIDVACPPVGPLREALTARGVTCCDWRIHDERGRRLPLAELRLNLQKLITLHRPDLVHANSLSVARIAGPVTKSLGVPSIGHLRDIVKLSRQALADLCLNDRLVAVSQATADFHVAQGIPQQSCTVIYNGVDLQQFMPRARTAYLHHELRLPTDARLIATIGQIGLRKGTDVAQSAIQRVVRSHPDVHWLVVGARTSAKLESRQFENKLRAISGEPPLYGKVHFLGPRNDVPRLLGEIELVLHAAHQEPLGRVLLEAAASGVPVVATDVGGTREIFPDAKSGARLSPPNDVAGLAASTLQILDQDGLRRALESAARRRVEEAFDARQSAAALIGCYCEVLRRWRHERV